MHAGTHACRDVGEKTITGHRRDTVSRCHHARTDMRSSGMQASGPKFDRHDTTYTAIICCIRRCLHYNYNQWYLAQRRLTACESTGPSPSGPAFIARLLTYGMYPDAPVDFRQRSPSQASRSTRRPVCLEIKSAGQLHPP